MPEIWGSADGRNIAVQWSEEDHGFIATVPSLPGCSAWGVSENDAGEAAFEAMGAWIEACIAAGNPVPPEDAPR